MKISEITEERTDEFIPAIAAAAGGLARGAAAVGGAAVRGAKAAGGAINRGAARAATNKLAKNASTAGAPAEPGAESLDPVEANKQKQEQKKAIQLQIKTTRQQLADLQKQLAGVR